MITSQNVGSRTDMLKRATIPDEIEFDGDNVQLNVNQQLYREQLIIDDSDNVTKNCDREITSHEKSLNKQKV